jgi:hypothetical protein
MKRGRGRPRKGEMHTQEDHQKAISPGPGKGSVSDREAARCLEPEGNGVNPDRGNGGGPGLPSGEQDKQLFTSREGDNSLMEQREWREEESGMTKRTHHAQST